MSPLIFLTYCTGFTPFTAICVDVLYVLVNAVHETVRATSWKVS